MDKQLRLDRSEAEGIGVHSKARTKSSKNPRWRKHNHSKNGDITPQAQAMGSLNGKTGYIYPDLKMVIYARNKKRADAMYRRLIG